MKKVFKIIAVIIGSLLLLNILLILFSMIDMGEIKALSVKTPDLSTFSDSTYTGSYKKGRWRYNVSVKIEKGSITEISHKESKISTPDKLNKEIISNIINKQSLSLDAVSGASVNTKALCKAVEVALIGK